MYLDRDDLQLLAFAARRTAVDVRAAESERTLWARDSAAALERLAVRLEDELARYAAEQRGRAKSR